MNRTFLESKMPLPQTYADAQMVCIMQDAEVLNGLSKS